MKLLLNLSIISGYTLINLALINKSKNIIYTKTLCQEILLIS